MRRSRESRPSLAAACLALGVFAACSNPGSGDESGGAGQATATAGKSGGGNVAGLAGTAGSTGAAGAPGSGGSVVSGGGTGGSTSNGGVAGRGGRAGNGGSTGGSLGIGGSGATNGSSGTGGVHAAGAGGVAGGFALGGNGNDGGVAGAARAGAGGSTGGAAGLSGAGGMPNTCPPATALTGGKQYCSNSKGTADGNYAYELWTDGTGMGCMTVYGVDAAFSATWTNAGDFLGRVGLGFDQTKTPSQIGTLSSDFAETKTGDTGLVYVGIYGWTVNPLREYYIIEDWGSTKPGDTASDGTPRTHVGTIMVDGDVYDVWKHTQTNKPAITGNNATFDQYFSVRQTPRQCGHISISEHFAQWSALDLDLGDLEEAKLLVEAQDGTGTIDFSTATVVVK